VRRDPDRISEKSIYPLFPVDEYVEPGMRILEAGCGMGRVFKHYFHEGLSIFGLEYDEACLKRLVQENPSFPLVCSDARRLSIASESMDMVMAFGLLSSLEHGYEDVMGEIRRVLRPDGWLCASVACDTLLRRIQNLVGWCGHVGRTMVGKPSARCFFARAFREHEWMQELEKRGFEVIRAEPTHSRALFWEYLPFLRQRGGELDLTEARDGDLGYRLRPFGEWLFQSMRERVPWLIAVGVVCIARKK